MYAYILNNNKKKSIKHDTENAKHFFSFFSILGFLDLSPLSAINDSYTLFEKKCNTLKDKFIVLQIDVTGSLSL